MSQLEVNKVLPQSGTTLTLGESGDTITIPSGATLDASSGTLTLPNGSVTAAKLASTAVDNTNTNSTVITGQTAETSIAGGDLVLVYDDSASALRKMTRTNFVAGVGGVMTPAFLAYLSADQSISDAVETKVQVNTEILDTNSCYDNTTNYRFTPTTAGKYFVFGNLIGSVAAVSRLSQIAISFHKNGTNVVESNDDKRSDGFGLGAAIYMSCVLDFNGTTDYVEMFAYINDNGGSNVDVGGNATRQRTIFGAYKIIQ
jgi:hypothetical protein